jgi:hypothetical protein
MFAPQIRKRVDVRIPNFEQRPGDEAEEFKAESGLWMLTF